MDVAYMWLMYRLWSSYHELYWIVSYLHPQLLISRTAWWNFATWWPIPTPFKAANEFKNAQIFFFPGVHMLQILRFLQNHTILARAPLVLWSKWQQDPGRIVALQGWKQGLRQVHGIWAVFYFYFLASADFMTSAWTPFNVPFVG